MNFLSSTMAARFIKVKAGDQLKVLTIFYQNGYRSMPAGFPRTTLFVGEEESHLEVPRYLKWFGGLEGSDRTFPTHLLLGPWTGERLNFFDKWVLLSLYVDLPNEVLAGVELLLPRWSSHFVVEMDDDCERLV